MFTGKGKEKGDELQKVDGKGKEIGYECRKLIRRRSGRLF